MAQELKLFYAQILKRGGRIIHTEKYDDGSFIIYVEVNMLRWRKCYELRPRE